MVWSTVLVGLLVASGGLYNALAQNASSPCTDLSFVQQPAAVVGPLTVRSLVQGSSVCIQASLQSATAKWIALAISRSFSMINVPNNNAIIFDAVKNVVQPYVLSDYSIAGVTLQADASSIAVKAMTTADGLLSFTIERPLSSTSSYDVAVDPNVPTNVLWAYADTAWPSSHLDRGSVKLQFATSA
ncbi:unnamed protein product, partial [Aphanomyces euteiches]